jgi:hypothetical protein
MTEPWLGPQIEFGRVRLLSWEHDWATSSKHTYTSLRDAERVLPLGVTAEIYAVLRREEVRLLRGSLPFPPYDFRMRLNENRPGDHANISNEDLSDLERRSCTLGDICPGWSEALRKAGLETNGIIATKRGRHGMLEAARADTPFLFAYSLEWHMVGLPGPIDRILRDLSPRYRVPNSDPWSALSEVRKALGNSE